MIGGDTMRENGVVINKVICTFNSYEQQKWSRTAWAVAGTAAVGEPTN